MNDNSLVCVEQLSRYYGELCAVDDVSFTIRRGEVVGFLGPNGAGKSTTMQIISGVLAPASGRVIIDGHDMVREPCAAKAALGYLPEQPPLYRDLTVDEYLAFCARLHGIAARRCKDAVVAAKARCGLGESGPRLIANLSKGYQQRVGIAQAILHEPDVVILDEPTVGLDPIQIREIRSLIAELAQHHSVVLSTHILPEVQAICDRVLIIHRGRLVLDDDLAGLQRCMETSRLQVLLRRPPPRGELLALPGVEAVEELGEGRLRIHHRSHQDPVDGLLAAALAGGWGLRELSPEPLSLEEVFMDLTHNTEAAA